MRIFGKERQSLRIKKAVAARAVYDNGEGLQEIELRLLTEDGERLTLQIPPSLARKLTLELSSAYEAINPPLRSSRNAADFLGMDDF